MDTEKPATEQREKGVEFNLHLLSPGYRIRAKTHNTEYVIEAREDGLYISGHPQICPEPTRIIRIGNGVVGFDWQLDIVKQHESMLVELDTKDASGHNKIMSTSAVETIGVQEKTESVALEKRILELADTPNMWHSIKLYVQSPDLWHQTDGFGVRDKFEQMVDLIKQISDRTAALNLVEREGILLYFMSDVFKNDPEIAIKALRTANDFYQYLPDEIKRNREVALASAGDPERTRKANINWNVRDLPIEFRADKNFIMEFLRRNGDQLSGFQGLPEGKFPELEKLSRDKDVIKAALESHWVAALLIPDELKNDREIVIAAVRKDGHSLNHWSYKGFKRGEGYDRNLCDDIEIVTEAVKQNPKAIEYVGDKLKNDPRILALIPQGEN